MAVTDQYQLNDRFLADEGTVFIPVHLVVRGVGIGNHADGVDLFDTVRNRVHQRGISLLAMLQIDLLLF